MWSCEKTVPCTYVLERRGKGRYVIACDTHVGRMRDATGVPNIVTEERKDLRFDKSQY
jgi:hypothetical protein